MKAPLATYRIQFNKDFTLHDLANVHGYLSKLGVDTIYASPILSAVAGSMHGYDGINMHQINPEIGNLEQLRELKSSLLNNGLGWLQDIVPNHMAFDPSNTWLMDLLEYGPESTYKDYFDTTYSGNWFAKEKLMIPTLGKTLEEAIADQEITIVSASEKLFVQYFDQRWPLSAKSAEEILSKHSLHSDAGSSESKLERYLAKINASDSERKRLLEKQHYRLCHWQETDSQINFRRFFTVNGLLCLNINRPEVFNNVHSFIAQLLEEGTIEGLRIDHIDGIYDPTGYLNDLRQLCGPETYIVAEKILEHGEDLPAEWPIQGTTGYEFLAASNNLQVDKTGKKKLDKFYEIFAGKQASIKQQQREKKAAILQEHMQGEVKNLYKLFLDLDLASDLENSSSEKITKVIASLLVEFPVYRFYATTFPLPSEHYTELEKIFKKVKKSNADSHAAINYFISAFKRAQFSEDENYRSRVATFFTRCMQFAGPVMAKGVEDTLMYTYNRYIGNNEVGDHPGNFGLSVAAFHKIMRERQQHWPLALNASATHDTKRAEDTRSRLQVITAWPSRWIAAVKKWHAGVEKTYTGKFPHPNDEYTIYQALYGAYPMPGQEDPTFEERFLAFLTKYLREGKERSGWATPHEEYEDTVHQFARFLLQPAGKFMKSFQKLLRHFNDFAIVNSLAQLTLKFTAPGIPDVYQGTELWDFSFVDPDNRRPIDYRRRSAYLEEIEDIPHQERQHRLWSERQNGKIKLWLLHSLAQLRKSSKEIFEKGSYQPLAVEGKYEKHVVAFARQYRNKWIVVILPLHLAAMEKLRRNEIQDFDWEDTRVILPTPAHVKWTNIWTTQDGSGKHVELNELFQELPMALLQYEQTPNPRRAGILMHISSLPSSYGIGDLGESAFSFARNLHAAGQRYWQVLPLNPLSKQQHHSPYSTLSAIAGNPLFIDMTALVRENILHEEDLQKLLSPPSNQIDYDAVVSSKMPCLYQAFERADYEADAAFSQFCSEQAFWLDDYALFMSLRQQHDDAPWYEWAKEYKERESKALELFIRGNERLLTREKWLQYLFFKQWAKLKAFCNGLDIAILGDIPIYVGHDSADVWANPTLFALAENGQIKEMAGVPPDYFNADGQQWGMPVFNWSNHKKENYRWWLARLKQNLALFDQVRLDHFRAFAAYWSIPASAETAAEGNWKTGPSRALFNKLKNEFPEMPFIAEDLGDIDDEVYALRDNYGLAGMKVLQFAFGDDMPRSPHIPHHYTENFVVYTGTHDNNTTVGWFKADLDQDSRSRLQAYLTSTVYAKNIADLLIKVAYASVANTVIIPMQDVLSLGKKHRMNTPSSTASNWSWRMLPNAFKLRAVQRLQAYALRYDRL
ncbi:malto-oligosyltrehalose synthase [Sphingobacterium paludis]|uniref:4-alpha-glucanotransferase n=1 Tax=Sphingobacterium paludis TaxID=1476465 RepID=A0A4R7DEM8_9SPHI|nr:malto-oligosyltrehalose synthase [Sphingobacterium paludis]TDS17636.1 4-alpha-glucanotransferase/malto-oligosyltrehalose synthase,TIGR02401 [Sphingobacterium paludis]